MNATRGTSVGLAALGALALACNLDKGPVAPRASIRADQVAAAVSSFVCDVDGATWEGDPDAAVLHVLAPSGVMRVAFNYNNRNNAARNPITGQLTGPGIDMTCKLAQGTHAQFVAVPYNGVPSLLAGLANGEWDAAFAFDQTLEPPGITAAIPHIAVENTYLVRGDAPFQKVADVDAPGVRISVAEGNSPDIYLSHTLKYATLVRTPATPQALAQRIAFLQHHVTRLVTNGVLNDGQGNALNVKLEGALRKLADGETEPAMNKLGAFINQVEAFRAAGILSETQSASLLEIARDVVMRAADPLALVGGVR